MPSPEISTLSLHDALPIWSWGGMSRTIVRRSTRTMRSTPGMRRMRPGPLGPTSRPSRNTTARSYSRRMRTEVAARATATAMAIDRKSTRLNSSHGYISYAVPRDLHSFPTRRSSDLVLGRDVQDDRAEIHAHHAVDARDEQDEAGSLGADQPAEPEHHRPLVFAQDADGGGREGHRHRDGHRSEEHTSELQSRLHLVCRPPRSPLFPYTTLFRSGPGAGCPGRSCGDPRAPCGRRPG